VEPQVNLGLQVPLVNLEPLAHQDLVELQVHLVNPEPLAHLDLVEPQVLVDPLAQADHLEQMEFQSVRFTISINLFPLMLAGIKN
jgi:hypothetical protein